MSDAEYLICRHCDGKGWVRYEPPQPRQPEDFTDEQRAAMVASNVEHELRVQAEAELIDRELAGHPDETIPEIAVRVARLTGHGTSRGRLSRVVGLVLWRAGLRSLDLREKEAWLNEAERLAGSEDETP
jgi:hypothetical protein